MHKYLDVRRIMSWIWSSFHSKGPLRLPCAQEPALWLTFNSKSHKNIKICLYVASSMCNSFYEHYYARTRLNLQNKHKNRGSHLIFLQTALLHHFVTLLLKGDDDEGHKYVDEEEGEHHKINDVKDGHLHSVSLTGTPVLLGHIHRVLQNSTMQKRIITDENI